MTKAKTKDLLGITGVAESVGRNASMLKYNIKNRRVTHTTQVLRQLVNAVAAVAYAIEDETSFIRSFEAALLDAQIGPTEFTITSQTTVYIAGSFSIEKLQQVILIASRPPEVRQ